MQTFWDKLADAYVKCPLAPAAIVIGLTLLTGFGLTRLSFDDSPHNVFKTEDEEFQFLNEVLSQFGADDNDCLLMVRADELFSAAGINDLKSLARSVSQVEGVRGVFSMADPRLLSMLGVPTDASDSAAEYTAAGERAMAHPIVGGQLLSEDGNTTLIIARLDPWRKNINQFEGPVAALRAIAKETTAETSLHVEMTGIPPLRVEIFAAVQSEQRKYTIIGSVLAFAMAFVLFRKVRLVMISAIGPILASLWTLGAMGLAGEKVNVLNVVLPTLVVMVGFTSSIHLLIDARRSLAEGKTVRQATRDAIAHLGGACTLAMITTVVGFASLAASSAEILRMFGLVCAGGVVCSFLAVILTVPVMMLWLMRDDADAARGQASAKLGHGVERLAVWIINRPKRVIIVSCLATLAPALLLPQLRPDTSLTETIPRERESYQTLMRCDEAFGGVLSVMIVVDWSENQTLLSPQVQSCIAEIEMALAETEPFHHPFSVRSIFRAVNAENPDSPFAMAALAAVPEETRDRLYRSDLRRTIVTARLPDLGAAAYLEIFSGFEQRLAEIANRHAGVSVRLTGTPKLAARNINQMVVDLAMSLSLAAVVIFGIITFAFRSFRLGLISLIPNLFPLILTAALLVVFDYPLQLASVIVFTICLGLAVDDTIHYLNRFRRELDASGDASTALRRASFAVGAALVTSTLVLLAGFGSVILSEIPTSRLFASLACTAMAAALAGDLVFLPALLAGFVKAEGEKPKA